MSTVLFIITIPTEAEETRRQADFITKKLVQRANIPKIIEEDEKSNSSAPSVVVNVESPLVTIPSQPSLAELNELEEECDGQTPTRTHTPTVEEGAPALPSYSAPNKQIITLPKRRESEPKLTLGINEFRESTNSLKDTETKEGEVKYDLYSAFQTSAERPRDGLHSSKRNRQKIEEQPFDLETASDASMERIVREIIKKFQIKNAVWTKDADGRMFQIIFTVQFDEMYEHILHKFSAWGFGERDGSTLCVMNCLASKTFSQQENPEETENVEGEDKQGVWNRFMGSVRSRLNATQVVHNVRQDAAITFDFLVLLISAAILAAFGLVEDSTVFLAASMLISPLMGPIIAGIFGTVIEDRKLCILGVKNELIGLLSATVVGFIFGMTVCVFDARYGSGNGLTNEMVSRCELHSLMVGVFTAIPSGAAAAVGILGGNVGSLIGVAISASLLPPAVNAGVLWALACICKYFEGDDTRYTTITVTKYYSDDQITELILMGVISMCVTISNIICVYVVGIIVLKIKEIAPLTVRNNNQFWKCEAKIARDMLKSGCDADHVLIDEFTNLPKKDQKALGIDTEILRNFHIDDASYQNTWSPRACGQRFDTNYELMRENYHTIHPIERLYATINQCHPSRDVRLRNRFQMAAHRCAHAEMGTVYQLLSDNIPTVSTKSSDINVETSDSATNTKTSTGSDAGSRKHKFIVTPATDPLLRCSNSGETIA